jgi:hypothetical protein
VDVSSGTTPSGPWSRARGAAAAPIPMLIYTALFAMTDEGWPAFAEKHFTIALWISVFIVYVMNLKYGLSSIQLPM